jgi:hypothetical protein
MLKKTIVKMRQEIKNDLDLIIKNFNNDGRKREKI